jgi:trehalose 6-phosphate synthase/phosphatase
MTNVSIEWKPDVRRILEHATTVTPGALVEEKTASLAWHYRMAEPELGQTHAEELWVRLEQALRGAEVELLRGEKVIEVRPKGVTKAQVLERVLAHIEPPLPTIAAMGDDRTDEDLFAALPEDAIAIGVGYRATSARYRVATPRAARDLLESILGQP